MTIGLLLDNFHNYFDTVAIIYEISLQHIPSTMTMIWECILNGEIEVK